MPSWQVLLLGGASGVGKSSFSYRLAQHYAVGLTEVDDFQIVLQHVTTPEQYPVVHFWRTQPEAWRRYTEEQHLAEAVEFGEVMSGILEPVIANHLQTHKPIVLEGDFILPSLATQSTYDGIAADGRVRALFLYEDDEEQLRQNFLAREGEPQLLRARLSWRYSEWLRAEAGRLGLPAIPARPWDTVFERALAAIDRAELVSAEPTASLTEEQLRQVTIGELTAVNAPITLVPPDPTWPNLFAAEARRIRAALGERALQIEHVGSTAVPGLVAKPIIDILLVVADSADESSYVPALEAAGYVLRIREPDWYQHRLFKGPTIDLNLHIFTVGCEEVERVLLFRDWLRTNEADRELYARTKRELAGQRWTYIQNYADAKSAVVQAILARAQAARLR
jgi:GrpB-like predicted nucleotidyltransferase (UPF0157 family)